MNRILAAALAAVSLAVIPGADANAQVRVDTSTPMQLTTVPLQLAPPVTCKNPGSSQDVAKTPSLVNTGLYAIPAGKTLFWKSSDGDSGEIKLLAPLAPQ